MNITDKEGNEYLVEDLLKNESLTDKAKSDVLMILLKLPQINVTLKQTREIVSCIKNKVLKAAIQNAIISYLGLENPKQTTEISRGSEKVSDYVTTHNHILKKNKIETDNQTFDKDSHNNATQEEYADYSQYTAALKNHNISTMHDLITAGDKGKNPPEGKGCNRLKRRRLQTIVHGYCKEYGISIPEYRNQNDTDVFKKLSTRKSSR